MYQKLSASYRRIMVNTADSPIMKIFESFAESADAAKAANVTPSSTPTPATAASGAEE
jgi:hypothetical protein